MHICFVLLVLLFSRSAVCETDVDIDIAMRCTFTSRGKTTKCQNGIWPIDNVVEIDPSTLELRFINIEIYENSTIPSLSNVYTLYLDNCKVRSASSGSAKFPLESFSRQLSSERMEYLSVTNTNLQSISKSDFHIGTASYRLNLRNCSIRNFHPNTLQAFVNTTNVSIIMSTESYLTSFPWYSLQYISHSLKELSLEDWPELELLDAEPRNHCIAENWTLPNLERFELRDVRKLSTVPGEIIRTVVRHTCFIIFLQNNASCYDCAETVQPLLRWLRTPDTKRTLSLGCSDKGNSIKRDRKLMMSDPFCEGLEECSTLSTPGDFVVTSCLNETWPGVKSPIVDVGTERLTLKDITTRTVSSLPPIPPIPLLTELNIIACIHMTFDWTIAGNLEEPFPMIAFTVNLKNSPVRFLRVEDTRLHSLNYSTFASFSKLESLILKNCRIPDIHPDTFRAFNVIPEPDSHPELTNNLQHFTLESNRVLKEFDWNWLAPLESSLKMICLVNNNDLRHIRHTQSANGSPAFRFQRLQNVSVIGNSLVDELSVDVLETMNHHSSNTTELNFASNRNPCSQCGGFSALAWAVGLPPMGDNPDVSRTLRYSCINDTETSTVIEDQDLQRELYNFMKEECLALFPSTTIPPTTSSSTTTTKSLPNTFRTTSSFCCTSSRTTETPSVGATNTSKDSKIIFITVGCAGMICLTGAIFVYICRKRRLQYRQSHDDDTRQWRNTSLTLEKEHHIPLADQYYPEESATKTEVASLTIDANKLRLTKKELGRGSQGTIVEGLASGLKYRQGDVTVAVKTFNRETLSSEAIHKMFVGEISAMCHAGFHPNLVNLLGVTTLEKDPALLLEFCEQGALLTFLNDHRAPFFYCHVDEDGNYLPFDEGAAAQQQSRANQAVNNAKDFDGLILSSKDLLSFSYQIAKAMEYLAHRTIIHRDLAARNVLVTRNRLVKVSDFGLARKGDNVYVMGSNAGLPVRWMPPEAMLTRCFSQSSDVWSYGVLLWELFSLGEMPYNDFTVLHGQLRNFINWLLDGHRLVRPSGTPADMYVLMTECWATDSDDRPTFVAIRNKLDEMISREVMDQYLQLMSDSYTHLEFTPL